MHRAVIKGTAAVFMLLAGMLWGGKALYDASLKERALDRHAQLLRTAQTLIRDNLLRVVQDTHQLALNPCMADFVEMPSVANRRCIEQALIDTGNVYGHYDQLRFIDLQGRERVRVNYRPEGAYAVAVPALQNKAERYYVQAGRALEVGQVYLSPLDLNVERGAIERPYKPMLRAVRMVGDAAGNPRGLLVLNYAAGGLLNRFRAHFPLMDRAMLLNAEGHWLLNHQRDNEWGWQLGQPQRTLAQWRPALWASLQTTPQGTLELDGHLFSFRRFDIAHFDADAARGDYDVGLGLVSDIDAAVWTMLVETAPAQWQADALYRRPWFAAFLVALFGMAAALVYFAVSSREQRRAAQAAQRRQLDEFRDLYENAPIGYITVAADGRISNVNRALLSYLDYTREELVGRRRFIDLVDTSSRQAASTLMDSLAAGETRQCRLALVGKSAERLIVLCSLSSRLSPSNTLMVGRCSVQDITEQASLERALERLAYHDPLTGLANRRYFDELADREIQRLRREGGPLTALALDIDRFKAVNDRYGHDVGDQVLKALAAGCQRLLRGTDILARFGGEEFMVLLPGATLAEGRAKAEALRQALAAAPVTPAAGEAIHYTVSIGVATLECPDAAQLPGLLKRADQALYQAKRSGRNRVCVAVPERVAEH